MAAEPDAGRPDPATLAIATQVLRTRRVAVMVVAYDASRHIESVLARIPREVAGLLSEIYVLDDHSQDPTYDLALAAGERLGLENLRVFRTPSNRGYGGNQKLGYTYAVEHGFDIVVMLHGDGQYAPEHLPRLIAGFADEAVNVVLGSRMARRGDALKGGMPLYKWLGNRVLTAFENRVLGVDLSEFHSGYRAFRVARLARIPFRYGSDGFHFDTEILIQLVSAGARIVEVPIPTHYGDEVCHVDGLSYAWHCARSVVLYRLFRMGLFYDPLLDFDLFEGAEYYRRQAANTLEQHLLRLPFAPGERILHLGAGPGYLSAEVAGRGGEVVAADREPPAHAGRAEAVALDPDGAIDERFGRAAFDTVLAIDALEHLTSPEQTAERLARSLRPDGRLLASTGNVGFFVTRLMLLMGSFNYSKRGILDLDHKRLFTVDSFVHLLRCYGFAVESVRGFGPPVRDLVSSRWPFSWIDSILGWLARVYPRLFAFRFLVVARRLPRLEEVYDETMQSVRQVGARPTAQEAVVERR